MRCPSISQVVFVHIPIIPLFWVHLFYQVFTNMVISTNLGQFNQNQENLGEGSPSVPFPCLRARLEMPEMDWNGVWVQCKNHGCHWVYRHEVSTMDLCGFINCMRYHLSLMSPGLGTWCFGHTQSSTWCASMFSGQDVGLLRDKVVATIQNGCDYSDTEIRLPQ